MSVNVVPELVMMSKILKTHKEYDISGLSNTEMVYEFDVKGSISISLLIKFDNVENIDSIRVISIRHDNEIVADVFTQPSFGIYYDYHEIISKSDKVKIVIIPKEGQTMSYSGKIILSKVG